MAAGVRLRSRWGVATLACLIIVYHLDLGEGLPLRGEVEGQVHLELLEESTSESVLDELAQAERIGSGEAAYNDVQGQQLSMPLVATSQLSATEVTDAVGKAAQVDLLASLDSAAQAHNMHTEAEHAESSTNDMFADALKKWDADKSSVDQKASQKDALLTTDLGNRVENANEESAIAIGGLSATLGSTTLDTGTVAQVQPLQTLEAAPATVSSDPLAQLQQKTPTASDPLAQFQQEFSTGLDDPDSADANTLGQKNVQLDQLSTPAQRRTALPADVSVVTQTAQPVQVAQATPQVAATDDKHDWMTKALAQWGSESEASLGPSPDDAAAPATPSQADDAAAHGDLGESDDIASTAAAAEKSLSTDVEAEAQQAASEVVKDTMKAVERDFMFTEKAITHKLGAGQKKLTLEDLEKAGGKTEHEKVKVKAKKAHKEMVHKAQMNFDLAIANVHKNTQQQLANQLAGLKKQLTASEDEVLSHSKMEQQQAKEDMENTVRFRTAKLMEEMKAKLPAKLTVVQQKAEGQARRVASIAIEQITSGAKKVRIRLRDDLGEAAGRVHAAESKLASSDKNPSLALKAAVDVRSEKAKYKKLHDLAESALLQQKSKASEKIMKAETNAKESVKLAVKDAQKKELGEAQANLAKAQKGLEAEEQKKLELKVKMIKEAAQTKIQGERTKFKNLVDAAVKIAPNREKTYRTKAKLALHKAKAAAQAYEDKLISTLAPHTVDGKTVTKEMAAECIKNPSGCSMFTLKGQNIGAATKFAENKARKAKNAQQAAKEGVTKALEKLQVTTKVADKYAREARSMDEKQTRIRLAKLQLNEAKAAAAFHSAAKAHLQSQLINTSAGAREDAASSKMDDFEAALKEMKLTTSEKTKNDAANAKVAKEQAFAKAREAAKALLASTQPS